MFEFMDDLGNYETRCVARTECDNGLTVSTAYSSDEGYETAILDLNGVHPVERYTTKEASVDGHQKWVDFANKAANGQEITKLGGINGLVEPRPVNLAVPASGSPVNEDLVMGDGYWILIWDGSRGKH